MNRGYFVTFLFNLERVVVELKVDVLFGTHDPFFFCVPNSS